MANEFSVRKKIETMVEAAQRIAPHFSTRGYKHFQLFDVTDDAVATCLDPAIELLSLQRPGDEPEALRRIANDIGVGALARWDKHSIFRMRIMNDTTYNDNFIYEVESVVQRRNENKVKRPLNYQGWSLACSAGILIPEESQIDLVNTAAQDERMIWAQMLGEIATLRVMLAILDRPTEFVQSRGIRTNRERMLNMPTVVTISLSKPIKISTPNLIHGGGWKMPEHDVRGHERRLKSGKVVWVNGHVRGDPHVQRKTTYKVIP